MTDRIAAILLGFPAWAALVAVFALPALESSAFVGFIFPGEMALILGGVLAQQGRVALVAVLAAGFVGAVVGDSVGYLVGRRYGRRVLDGTMGRFVKRDHFDRAERYLAERGGRAVFLGRFTAALRVMVPGAAGMARMRYRTFVVYNVAGAAGWVTLSVLLGYLGGSSWQHVAQLASRVGLGVLVLLVLLVAGGALWRRVRHASWENVAQRLQTRLEDHALATRARARYPRATGWVGRRFDPRRRRGLAATLTAAALVASTWSFGGITQDVLQHDELAADDAAVHSWVLGHRTPVLDGFFKVITYLGSNTVLVPLLVVVAGVLAWRLRSWRPAIVTAVVYGAAVTLHGVIAAAVQRARPPVADWLAPASGWSYTSGHTTQAWAGWGVLALLTIVYGRARPRMHAVVVAVVPVALLISTLVGISRVYLGVHWLTDVLGGAAMSVALLAACTSIWLVWSDRGDGPGTSEHAGAASWAPATVLDRPGRTSGTEPPARPAAGQGTSTNHSVPSTRGASGLGSASKMATVRMPPLLWEA
jgi:membrane protein DedA with SNARE-associated domain/membrane-associated phospholipid phosphatase